MRAAALCASLLLCGCSRGPLYYAPPAQFAMPPGSDSPPELTPVKMNRPDAPFSILDGVLDAGHGWGFKWTLDHARFQFMVGDLSGSDLLIHYAIDPTTLRDRGSIRVTIAIDGKPFQTFVESSLGEHERRWPAGSINSQEVRTLELSLTVDPPWISPDGTKLGVFLDAIGFAPRK